MITDIEIETEANELDQDETIDQSVITMDDVQIEHEESTRILAASQRDDPNIQTQEQFEDKIDKFADYVKDATNNYRDARTTIKNELLSLVAIGKRLDVPEAETRKLIDLAFERKGVSQPYLRRLLPPELKTMSHTNKRYLGSEGATGTRTNNIDRSGMSAVVESLDNQGSQTQSVGYDSRLQDYEVANIEHMGDANEIIKSLPEPAKNLVSKLLNTIGSLRDEIKNLKSDSSMSGAGPRKERLIGLRGYLQMKNGSQYPVKVTVNVKSEIVEYIEPDETAFQKQEQDKIEREKKKQ